MAGHSLSLSVTADLSGFKATGHLTGLLYASAGQNNLGPTGFTGTFTADVAADGGATLSLTGSAQANLHLDLAFSDDDTAPFNPKLSTDFHLLWDFNNNDPSGARTPSASSRTSRSRASSSMSASSSPVSSRT